MTHTEKKQRPGRRRGSELNTQDSPALETSSAAGVSGPVPVQSATVPKRGRPRKAEPVAARAKALNESFELKGLEAESPADAGPKRGRGRPPKKSAEEILTAVPENVAQTGLESRRATPRKTVGRPASKLAASDSALGADSGAATRTTLSTAPAAAPDKAPGKIFAEASAVTESGALKALPDTRENVESGRKFQHNSNHFFGHAPGKDSSGKEGAGNKNLSRPKTSLLKGRTPERSAFKHPVQNTVSDSVPNMRPGQAPVDIGGELKNPAPGIAAVPTARDVAPERFAEPKERNRNKKNAMEQFYARAYAGGDNYLAEKPQRSPEVRDFNSQSGHPQKPSGRNKPGIRSPKSSGEAALADRADSVDSARRQKREASAGRGFRLSGNSPALNNTAYSDNQPSGLDNRGHEQGLSGLASERSDRRPVGRPVGRIERREMREASGKASSRLPRPLRSGNAGRGGKNISSVYRPERLERSTEGADERFRGNTERPAKSERGFDARNAESRPARQAELKSARGAEVRSGNRPLSEADFSSRGVNARSSRETALKAVKEQSRNSSRQQKSRHETVDRGETDIEGRRGHISNWPTRPARPPKGGIKASSKGFVESWWGRSWLSSLEDALGHSTRLNRGRQYAKAGHVTQIVVEKCRVKATVCGNHVYHVHFRISPLNFKAWSIVGRVLGSQAALAARLLNGELPEEINHGLARAGLSLIPDFGSELSTQCSCPDKSNPCKHIAAVHYLLAEEIDRDPFLLLCLRGKEREEVIALMAGQATERLAGRRSESDRESAGNDYGRRRHSPNGEHDGRGAARDYSEGPGSAGSAGADIESEAGDEETRGSKRGDVKPLSKLLYAAPEPMPSIPDFFWGRILSIQPLPMPGAAQAPETPDALPGSLGAFPFWRGEEDLRQVLQEVYSKAAQKGLGDAEEIRDDF